MAHIDQLRREHRDRVTEVLRETAAFRAEEVDVALELFDAAHPVTGDAADPDYNFIGAFDGARLLGFACYGRTPGTNGTYDLYWLAVDPRVQGSGAGSLLVSAVEQRLREGHGRMVVAETSSRSDYVGARSFYEARGFTEAGRIPEFYAPGDDRVIYTKRVEPTA